MLYHGLNVTLMVLDGHPFLTRGTFGVPAPVTLVADDRVLGLTFETGFDGLTLSTDFMITFAWTAIKLAVTQTAILGGTGAPHILRTIKASTRRATSPLTSVISSVVGVEPSFTVQAIIRTVDKGGKRRAAVKMIIGFE